MDTLGLQHYTDASKQYGTSGSNPFAQIAKRYQVAAIPGVQKQLDYSLGLENHREGLLNSLLQNLTPGALKATANRQKNSIYEGSTRAGANAAQTAKGLGYGDGVSGGLLGGIINSGRNQAAQVDDKYSDPGYINSLYSQGLSSIAQGMDPTFLQTLLGLEPTVTNQAQLNSTGGLWDKIAPIAGQYAASGGFK